MKSSLFVFLFIFLQLCSARAEGPRGPFGIGVGAGVGVGKHLKNDGGSDVFFINTAIVRAHAFWFFGVDYEYSLGKDPDRISEPSAEELNYHTKMRLSALLYSFSFGNSALYMKGGIGASRLKYLFKLDAPGESYHFGGGAEFYIDPHVVCDVSLLVILPGVHSITQRAIVLMELPDMYSMLSMRNHEFLIRLFLFF